MMPTLPRSHLVVGQTRLPLGAPQAILDSVFGLEHPGVGGQLGRQRRVGEQIVVLPTAVPLTLAEHHQRLGRGRRPTLGSRLHQTPDGLNRQRSFLPVADLYCLPGVLGQGGAPTIHAREGRLRPSAAARVGRLRRRQIAHRCVRRHGQQIALAARPQFFAEPRATAHFVVAGHPSVRQRRPAFVQHFQGQLVPRAEANPLGNPGFLPPRPVAGPLLGQVEAEVDQGVFAMRDVAQVDADLTVVEFAEPAAPLPLHTHRLRPFLGEGRRVKDQHPIGFAQLRPHLPRQFRQQGAVFPLGLADELLQTLPLAVVQIGNRFNVLAVQVRQQTLDVVPGVGLLFRRTQRGDERLQERFQTRHHAAQQTRMDLGIIKQFVESDTKTPLHGSSPASCVIGREELYANDLRPIRPTTQ